MRVVVVLLQEMGVQRNSMETQHSSISQGLDQQSKDTSKHGSRLKLKVATASQSGSVAG